MFVESFLGQYKDGTNGTRDFRMVSASFLLLRILILASFHVSSWYVSAGPQAAVLLCALCFHAIVKPYKMNCRNNVDILILALLMVFSVELLVAAYAYPKEPNFTHCALGSALLLSVPHMTLIFYICYVLSKKAGITQCLERKYKTLKACVQATRHISQAEDAESDTNSLPDRVINPGEYEQLLPTMKEHAAAESTENRIPTNGEPRCLTPVYTYGSIK